MTHSPLIDVVLPEWPLHRHGEDPTAFLEDLAATGQDVVPFRLGRRPAFLLNSPSRVEDVLVRHAECFEKGRGYAKASRLLGTGLLTAEGTEHKQRRLVAQGAFHRAQLEAAAPIIVRHAAACRSRWRPDSPLDIAKEMRELTLAIAGESFFGADLGPWVDVVARAVTGALAPMDGLLAIVAPPSSARRARRELDVVIDAILAARRAAPATHHDLLAVLMDASTDDPAGVQQLRDDVLTFLLAGHDTVSHALTWTWLLLAEHPDVDECLTKELEHVLGSRLPQSADVPRLVYTRAIVKEALRLFPPAWVIVRRAMAPVRLGDVDIPEGALVVASPLVTQRDSRYFPQPRTFAPQRWLAPDEEAARPKLAYFPFGAGPRACIGEGFAWVEATLALATLARHWRLQRTSDEAVQPIARITLRPATVPPLLPIARPRSYETP